jgi:hypothetical protein
MAIDLDYDPDSLAGPPDKRTLDKHTARHYVLDRAYLDHARRYHGGIPGKAYLTAPSNEVLRVGRFLTLFDSKSDLPGPHRPSWIIPGRDARIDYSAWTLVGQEGNSCRHLFGGDELLPFAALHGPHHPDEMDLTDGYVDLLCFFYRDDATKKGERRPNVVRWDANLAREEYWRWAPVTGIDDHEPVRYGDFTEPIAVDFDRFLEMLRDAP